MSNTIGSINYSSMMGSTGSTSALQRPDPSKMVEDLFSQIDTEGKGYIDSSDLEEAMSQLATDDGSESTASADELFSAMDSDGDGKVTQSEMSDTLQTLADSMDFAQGMGGPGAMGGMPPPPPPSSGTGGDSGFTEDELTSQLESLNSSDSLSETDQARADLISSIVSNFDEADTNGDGKVDGSEAMAYEQSSQSSDSGTSTTTTTATDTSTATASTTSASSVSDVQLMHTIMRLMHAYGPSSQAEESNSASSLSALA